MYFINQNNNNGIIFCFKQILDLRIKSETPSTPNPGEFPINKSTASDWKIPDNGTPPSPSNHGWKIDASHKNVVSTLADGNV